MRGTDISPDPRLVEGDAADELRARAATLPKLTVGERTLADLECLGAGVFAPLTGFLAQSDYDSVVEKMQLADGNVWSLPICLAATEDDARTAAKAGAAGLYDDAGSLRAVIDVTETYGYDARREAELVYRTIEEAHPGVAAVYSQPPVYVGGPVRVLAPETPAPFAQHRLTPAQTRAAFAERGWRTVVAFQTRNPVHRAHEYLQKVALEGVDGLLLHPLVGTTKGDDIPADIRMRCYEALLEHYYPLDRTLLAVFPAAMRYAGPREAVFHAVARRNYGATHFIVGRDHAGVGSYYGTFDAHRIFDDIDPEALGITPLFFDHAFWCTSCGGMATVKTCPHPDTARLSLSGTKVRELLAAGEPLPVEFTRPEVAEVLRAAYAD